MSDPYRGQIDDKRYRSETIDVTFSPKRCIHAAKCVHGLPAVFDVNKRPWIQPTNETADQIAEVVVRCPSGALHFERQDGGAAESVPAENVITIEENSYIRMQGDLQISGTSVAIEDETRATLCRCGASSKKPFCDNSHKDIEFSTSMAESKPRKDALQTGGPLKVTIFENGPIELEGNFEIQRADGETIFQSEGKKTWLCRCGHSGSKPFCDQTHRKIGFEAP